MPAIIKAAGFLQGVQLLPPVVDTARNGTGVDLTGYEGTALVSVNTGAAAGSGIMKVSIEDSADNSSFATVTSFATSGFMPNTSGSNQTQVAALDLGQCRRYVRAVTTLVSGTSLLIGVVLHPLKKVGG